MAMIRTLILLLLAVEVTAQQQVFRGMVMDEVGQPLSGAHVYKPSHRESGTVTDASGFFSIPVNPGDSIMISHISYNAHRIIVTGTILREKAPYPVILSARQRTLEQVEITQKRDHRFRFLHDFEVSGKYILRLESLGKSKYLVLTGNREEAYWKCQLPNELRHCNKLDKDFLGNFVLLSDDIVYQLICNAEQCQFFPGVELNRYQELMKPCLAMLSNGILFRTYGEYSQSVDLQVISKDRRIPVYSQADKLAGMHNRDLDGIRTPHAGLGFAMADPDTGKERAAALYSRIQLRGSGLGAASRGISKPVAVETVCRGDSIIIFDHFAGEVLIFDNEGHQLNSVPMGFNHSSCLGKYYTDDLTGSVYGLFRYQRGICLMKILPETGELSGSPIFLDMLFPEKIRITGQKAYYFRYNHLAHERILLTTSL